MKMMRRWIALVLAVGIVFAMMVTNYSADGFKDVPVDHWAYRQIQQAVKDEITTGYQDGTFKPAASVTYAHFAAFLARAFYKDEIQSREGEWYAPYVAVLTSHDLYRNVPLKENNPFGAIMTDPISRYDMASLMYAIMVDKGAAIPENAYEQLNQIKDYATFTENRNLAQAVCTCYQLGLLTGYADGTFGGGKNMNRAQACVVISRMQEYLSGEQPDREGEVTPVQPEKPFIPEKPVESVDTERTLANGKPITEENIKEILAEQEKKYPNGDHSFGTARYAALMLSDGAPRIFDAIGCVHFALKMSDEIFGYGTKFKAHHDFYALKPGDVVEGKTHWFIVTDIDIANDRFTIADAGTGADAEVNWGYSPMLSVYAATGDYYTIWTRY